MNKTHLRFGPIAELSVYPKYHCPICKQDLWTEKSQRTNGQIWLVTKDGRRHYKSRCNFVEK